MNKEELLKETYYINGEWFNNIDIENEIKKYIRNIEISVSNEVDTIYVFGRYEYSHCKIPLVNNYLYTDYEKYLEYIAMDIVHLISKEYFLKENSNE